MKRIQSYRVFESNSSLKVEIGDYLQDLTDSGIDWVIREVGAVSGTSQGSGERLQIILTGRMKIGNLRTWQYITWGDVSSSVLSVIDFLETSGWEFTSLDGTSQVDSNLEITSSSLKISDKVQKGRTEIFSTEEVALINPESLWDVMIFDFRKVPGQLKESLNYFGELISGLRDYCEDFYPLQYRLNPDFEDSIGLNLVRLNLERKIAPKRDFYLIVEVSADVMEEDTRTGKRHLKEDFILTCREIESLMGQCGFKTLVSVKYPADWENLDTIDELGEVQGTIFRIKLEFVSPRPIENRRYL